MPTSKQNKNTKVGQKREPVAEYTTFGWVISAGSKKRTCNCLMLTRMDEGYYAELCILDVLGLKEDASNIDNYNYHRFRDQLGRNEEGWDETNIVWKNLAQLSLRIKQEILDNSEIF